VAAFLAAPDVRRSLDYLAQALLGYRPVPITELIGERGDDQRSLREVPVEELADYAVEDADVALQLWERLEPMLEESGQRRVYDEVEAPLIPVLAAMEHAGIRVDPDILKVIRDDLAAQIETTAQRIEELAGEPFNLNSPAQLGQILFEKLDLDPNARRTAKSKQYKTDEMVLTRLSHEHEIARQILHFRLCTKLKSTYLDMLPGAIFGDTGRVHTHYEQAVAATGRMQSSNPNLQNIPIRTDEGIRIREAFVPAEGCSLVSADYSQVELRILAHFSGDESLIDAFARGEDVHRRTAAEVAGIDPEDVSPDQRARAKAINFGIIYGSSAFGIANQLGIAQADAQSTIDAYFAQYRGVRRFLDATVEAAKREGLVRTLLGRRRYLPDLTSRNRVLRQAAERMAVNTVIQGTAADLIKKAMVEVTQALEDRELSARMILQVHDELVFEVLEAETGQLESLVRDRMESVYALEVPLVVEVGLGSNWREAH
jgi:DNA polymerase-1